MLVVGTEIDSPLENFLISVEVEKFPRASSSSAGRPPKDRRRSSSSRREVFDGPLSGQSVHEQTSGVLRHTESVRDDKVQEQDWRHALVQKSRTPPARPSDDITAQSHSVPGGQSVSDIQVRTLRTAADARSNDPVRVSSVFRKKNQSERRQLKVPVAAYHEAAGVRSLVLCYVSSRAHRKWPALPPPRYGTTSCTVTESLTRGLCAPDVLTVSPSLMEGSSRSRRPPSSRPAQAYGCTPRRRSLVCLVSRARQ